MEGLLALLHHWNHRLAEPFPSIDQAVDALLLIAAIIATTVVAIVTVVIAVVVATVVAVIVARVVAASVLLCFSFNLGLAKIFGAMQLGVSIFTLSRHYSV